jgi:hypothetical protein
VVLGLLGYPPERRRRDNLVIQRADVLEVCLRDLGPAHPD